MVSLAIFWQEGLHILLSGLVPSKLEPRSKCYADTDERYFSRSIAYAIDLGNLESLVILSDAGYPVFPEAWKKSALFYLWSLGTEEIMAWACRNCGGL